MNKIQIEKNKDGFVFDDASEAHSSAYFEEKLLLDVSDKIISEMDRQKMSRKELADRLDVSPAYITKVLRGHANLTIESLAKIAFSLGMRWEPDMIELEANVIGSYRIFETMNKHEICSIQTTTNHRDMYSKTVEIKDEYAIPA